MKQLTAKDILNNAEDFETLVKRAAGMSRKDVAKCIEKAKKEYLKHKEVHDSAEAQIKELQNQINSCKDQMLTARDTMVKHHDVLRCMDLAGADEARFRGQDVSYVKDRKEFKVQPTDDGGVVLVPFKALKVKPVKEEDIEEEKEEKADIEVEEEKEKEGDDKKDADDGIFNF